MYQVPIVARFIKPLFPHISRIFSAPAFQRGVKILFWISCIIFFIGGIITSHSLPQSYDEYRKEILTSPFSMSPYIRFGQALFHQGNNAAAKKQIAAATNVLGAHSELQQVVSEWEYALQSRERSYAYWKHIIAAYPEYRDGYVQLALVSYDLARFNEAEAYLHQAQTVDPNNPVIGQMQKEMGL